jgi:hypothetical protein
MAMQCVKLRKTAATPTASAPVLTSYVSLEENNAGQGLKLQVFEVQFVSYNHTIMIQFRT